MKKIIEEEIKKIEEEIIKNFSIRSSQIKNNFFDIDYFKEIKIKENNKEYTIGKKAHVRYEGKKIIIEPQNIKETNKIIKTIKKNDSNNFKINKGLNNSILLEQKKPSIKITKENIKKELDKTKIILRNKILQIKKKINMMMKKKEISKEEKKELFRKYEEKERKINKDLLLYC